MPQPSIRSNSRAAVRLIAGSVACLIATSILFGCRSAPADAPIAFLAQSDGAWQVWWLESSRSKPKRISRLNQDVVRMSWFPGGRELLLNLQDGTLMKLDAAAAISTEVDFPADGVQDAVIDPSGKRIAYSVSFTDSGDRNDIWIYDMTNRATRKLTSMPGLQHNPTWSADGRSIYFLGGGGTQAHDIWRVDAVSGSKEQITINAYYHFDPVVRADGTLAFSGNRGGDYDVWLLSPKGEPQRITADPDLDAHPSWSPDGKALVFESTRQGGTPHLWRYDLSTKETTRLTDLSGGARMPVWAPAGARR